MEANELVTRQGLVGDVDPVVDRLLVERSQAGDQDAFAQLYDWYRGRIVRYCGARLGDARDAEDASQEAFARAWNALRSFDGERRFYPWLQVIAHNVCVDWNRRSRATPITDEQLVELGTSVPAVDDGVLAAIDSGLALGALQHLPARYQEVLELREQRGWSYQRIADQARVPVSTIETLLFRARRAFRKEFLALVGGDGAVALFLIRLHRGVVRLIGLRRAAVSRTLEAPAIVARVTALSGVIAGATIAGVLVVGPTEHRSPASMTTTSSRFHGFSSSPARARPDLTGNRMSSGDLPLIGGYRPVGFAAPGDPQIGAGSIAAPASVAGHQGSTAGPAVVQSGNARPSMTSAVGNTVGATERVPARLTNPTEEAAKLSNTLDSAAGRLDRKGAIVVHDATNAAQKLINVAQNPDTAAQTANSAAQTADIAAQKAAAAVSSATVATTQTIANGSRAVTNVVTSLPSGSTGAASSGSTTSLAVTPPPVPGSTTPAGATPASGTVSTTVNATTSGVRSLTGGAVGW